MPYCPFCGKRLKKEHLFCMECGKKVEEATRLRTRASHSGLEAFLETQAAVKASLPSKEEIDVKVTIKPPPTAVKTVRELILWEYAKLIAHAAKLGGNYRFIMSRYTKLKKGQIKWSSLEEDAKEMMVHGERTCIYCGAAGKMTEDHIVPLCKGGPDIPINIVPACKRCNSSKIDKDIFEWYFLDRKCDTIPRKVWSRYLKLVWEFHALHRTLDRPDINRDGKLDIQDIGAIFKRK